MTIVIMLPPGHSSLRIRPLIVTLNLIIPRVVVVISVVFVWMRRRMILAALTMIQIWDSRSRLGIRKDHWMWILKVWWSGRLGVENTWVSKGLRLKVDVWGDWRGQKNWWEVLRMLEICYRIVCPWTLVLSIDTERLEVSIKLVMRNSTKSWL